MYELMAWKRKVLMIRASSYAVSVRWFSQSFSLRASRAYSPLVTEMKTAFITPPRMEPTRTPRFDSSVMPISGTPRKNEN